MFIHFLSCVFICVAFLFIFVACLFMFDQFCSLFLVTRHADGCPVLCLSVPKSTQEGISLVIPIVRDSEYVAPRSAERKTLVGTLIKDNCVSGEIIAVFLDSGFLT